MRTSSKVLWGGGGSTTYPSCRGSVPTGLELEEGEANIGQISARSLGAHRSSGGSKRLSLRHNNSDSDHHVLRFQTSFGELFVLFSQISY